VKALFTRESRFESVSVTTTDNNMSEATLPTWSDYFDSMQDLAIDADDAKQSSFRVYTAGDVTEASECIFALFHGGGHSSMSWALAASLIKNSSSSKHPYGCIAFDYRAHGHTTFEGPEDLSTETLVNDAFTVLSRVLPTSQSDIPVPVVLVGHSVGGGVVVHLALASAANAAAGNTEKVIPGLSGVVVIDVVEGSALASLALMPLFLSKRPASFGCLEDAIEWSIKSSTLHNIASAKISIPAQLKVDPDSGAYVWRTDLAKTEPWWQDWYTGLSAKFLSIKVTKMLIVAGRDRMDDELTVAQMQGKFQFVLVGSVGHCVQEDAPETVAEKLVEFAQRNRFKDMAKLNAKLKKK
jgi:protein phosphatase methylesterase 1